MYTSLHPNERGETDLQYGCSQNFMTHRNFDLGPSRVRIRHESRYSLCVKFSFKETRGVGKKKRKIWTRIFKIQCTPSAVVCFWFAVPGKGLTWSKHPPGVPVLVMGVLGHPQHGVERGDNIGPD